VNNATLKNEVDLYSQNVQLATAVSKLDNNLRQPRLDCVYYWRHVITRVGLTSSIRDSPAAGRGYRLCDYLEGKVTQRHEYVRRYTVPPF
jgi:hypothetical protein